MTPTPTTHDRARAALAIGPVTWSSAEGNGHFHMSVDSLPSELIDAQLAALEADGLAVVDVERLERLRAAATAAEPYCWTHWAAACEVLRPGDIDPLPATADQEEGR